jgi:hypothetical protein
MTTVEDAYALRSDNNFGFQLPKKFLPGQVVSFSETSRWPTIFSGLMNE